MVIVHAFISVKEDSVQKFFAAIENCVIETRKEPGCRFYTLYTSNENPLKFVLVEEWDSKAALDNHFTLPHFIALGENIEDLLAEPLDIKIFEANQL